MEQASRSKAFTSSHDPSHSRPAANESDKALIEQAPFFSLITFHWVGHVLSKANHPERGVLVQEDFGVLSRRQRYATNFPLWDAVWNTANGNAPMSGFFAIVKTYPLFVTGSCVVVLIAFALQLVTAYVLFQALSSFLSDPTQVEWIGWVLVVAMLVSNVLANVFMSNAWVLAVYLAECCKAGVISMVFKRAYQLKNLEDVGMVTNIVTNDADRVFECAHFLAFGLTAPLHILATLVLFCVLLGWPAVPGAVALPLCFAAVRLLANLLGRIRFRALPLSDKRISQISELLNSVASVKLYNYEEVFSERIERLRTSEIALLRLCGIVVAAMSTLIVATTVIPVLISMLLFISFSGTQLTPSIAFTTLSLLNGVWFSAHMLTLALSKIGQAAPCFERLRVFLSKPVLAADRVDWRPELGTDETPELQVQGATFAYSSVGATQQQVPFSLKGVSFKVSSGCFTMVAGPVGSGKTTLLLGVLGEIDRVVGSVRICGRAAYCAQTAFIINGSLRDNILFGLPLNDDLYAKCISVACLSDDLKQLVDGDATIIGEKGVNLSGGQKQRVSIARALYSQADVYLFDDVLSALDARVGKLVFRGIRTMLSNKCVVFTNHQLQYAPMFDQIIVLSSEGDCVESGSHAELMALKGAFCRMLEDYQEEGDDETQGQLEPDAQDNADAPTSQTLKVPEPSTSVPEVFQLVKAEVVQQGRIGAHVWWDYFLALGPLFPIVFTGIMSFNALRTYSDFHLSAWVSSAGHGGWSFDAWMAVFIVVTILSIVLMFASLAGLVVCALRASKVLHDSALRAVLRGTMSFFQATPVGRILNRFSKDVEITDSMLPFALDQALIFLSQSLSIFVAIAVVYPIVLVTFPFIVVAVLVVSVFLRNGTRQCRRVVATTRSHVVSNLNTMMSGIITIRAFGAVERYENAFEESCDVLGSGNFMQWMIGRWFNLRLDLIVTALTFVTSIIAVATRTGSGALGSLAIAYSIRLASSFQWAVRNGIDVENYMTAAERLDEMSDPSIVPVEPSGGLVQPPADWPREGRICFDDVHLRYRPELPLALQGLTFVIEGGQHCGIVGRTGAGKSSMVQALFRMVELTGGAIRIDGIDIAGIPLPRLRRALSVIPQDPVIFRGSWRFNLDPYTERTDDEIREALRSVRLDHLADVGLESDVEELSQGEKQLLSIARALLRRARIVVADEASSSIDTKTDGLLQDMMRKELSQCTTMSIAHRINTVITADMILLLSNGQVQEQDRPERLLASQSSQFRSLVMETGAQSSRHLIQLANNSAILRVDADPLTHNRDPIEEDFTTFSIPL